MRRRRAARVAVFLAVGALAAGCGGGPSENELAARREAEQERVFDEIDDRPIWIGTVLAFEDTWSEPITFDYGGRYETKIDVSRIAPVDDCDPDRSAADRRAFTAFLAERARPGTRLALVRSSGLDDQLDSEGFLRPLRPDGTPDMDGPSINEQMVAAGVARPDPGVALRESSGLGDRPIPEVLAQQREWMTPVDFENWSRFVDAYRVADERRVGPVGVCAEFRIGRQAESDRQSRELSERTRRFELGPDGRRGTDDDFTDSDGDGEPDTSGGGSGGGFDFPDGLCPTRFC